MTSKIKVDNIENQCGGAVVTKCGGTTTISGSVVKANTLQASDAGNIISQSGTTITLGASGDTINLASGASQTGFGRTGTVDWQTGSIKTSTFTAVSGEGYFVDTSGSVVTANLPASPSAGDIVAFADYTRTFGSNNLTIGRNSEPIGGVAQDAFLNVNGQAITLVYVDGTEGWINVQNAEDTETGLVPSFIAATGGTITTVCTDYKVHTFTGPGTFTVTSAGNAAGSNSVSYMAIAGGGGGANNYCQSGGQGGGGAGGFREGLGLNDSYTGSPLRAPTGIPVTTTGYPIAVGGGGAGAPAPAPDTKGTSGVNSTFSTITSAGGGGGASNTAPGNGGNRSGNPGGSGGGSGSWDNSVDVTGGAGNTPPVSPPQGQNGGAALTLGAGRNGGGGGGAGVAGTSAGCQTGGPGGNGVSSSINATPTIRAGGGAGATSAGPGPAFQGSGGSGGGGSASWNSNGGSGTANTGGGGAAASHNSTRYSGGAGGSGIVIIRYKFQ
jgi:hypothetical protein